MDARPWLYIGGVILLFWMFVGRVVPPDGPRNPCTNDGPPSVHFSTFVAFGALLLGGSLGAMLTMVLIDSRTAPMAMILSLLYMAASAVIGVSQCGLANYSPFSTCIGAIVAWFPWVLVAAVCVLRYRSHKKHNRVTQNGA